MPPMPLRWREEGHTVPWWTEDCQVAHVSHEGKTGPDTCSDGLVLSRWDPGNIRQTQ